jgi:hypothetical protein
MQQEELRNMLIVDSRNKGLSFTFIGSIHGISRQRTEEIYSIHKDDYSPKHIPLKYGKKIEFTGRDYTRELVRMRDGYKCQKCGHQWKEGERRLDVHHKGCDKKRSKGYDRVQNMNEMIALDHKCHMNVKEHIKSMELAGRHLIKNPSPTEPFAGTVQNKL